MTKYENRYQKQLQLLVTILPQVIKEDCFCIKGGTAINLFYTNMPRISVDIDLVYLPFSTRETAIKEIERALLNIKGNIENLYDDIQVNTYYTHKEKILSKLYVSQDNIDVIIEPNFILRGSLLPPEKKNLVRYAESLLKATVSNIPLLSKEEVYAGKICAALDRQHPRDLFDIKVLYESGGVTDKIRQAFVVYLASSSRPISEILNPSFHNIESIFSDEFSGMSIQPVTLDELLEVREQLVKDIQRSLTQNEKEFLISMKRGEPKWDLLPFENLDQLPALRWKLINVQRMDTIKRKSLIKKLDELLLTI